jgi:putative endonuclease
VKPQNNIQKGNRGQAAAEAHLKHSGYAILARNFRVRGGEIDLIALAPDGTVAFIEVKMRRGTSHGMPREAVGYKKQRRIINTALFFIAQNELDGADLRFDVIEILELNGRLYVQHIEDAFQV